MNPSDAHRHSGWRLTVTGRIALAFGALLVAGWVATLYTELYGLPWSEHEGWVEHIRRTDLQQLSFEAESRRVHVEEWIKERRNDVELIAASVPTASFALQARPGHLPGAALPKTVEWLRARKDIYGMIDALLLIAPGTGALLASTDDQWQPGSSALPKNMLAILAEDGADEAVNIDIDPVRNAPQLIIARKVRRDGGGAPLAYVVAIVDLEEEIQGRAGTQLLDYLGATVELNLYDRGGRFVTKPRFASAEGSEIRPLRSFDKSKLPMLATQGGEGHIVARDYRDVTVLAAYRYVRITPEVGWGLVLKKDESETLAAIGRHARTFVWITAIGLLGVILASWLLARRLTRPIAKVVGAARAISEGDWRARADVDDHTEIGELAETFNRMASRLAAWHEELAEQVRLKTERILAEEGKLTSFSETTVDAMIIIDDQGLVSFWNPAAERIFGHSRAEALGQDIHRLLAPAYLRPKADDAFRSYVRTGSGPIINTLRELPALTKDGRLITIELTVSSLEQGGRHYSIGTARDITARKQAESALRLVAEQLSVKVGDEYFRSLAATLAGLVRADYVFVAELDPRRPGQATTVGIHTPGGLKENFSYPLVHSPCAEVLANRIGIYPDGLQALFPQDRSLVDMGVQSYAGVPLTDKDGRVIGLIAALWQSPLTAGDEVKTYLRIFAARAGAELERLHAERALAAHLETLEARVVERTAELSATNSELAHALEVLNKAQTELVESEKLASLGSLVAGIAHELNTPIGNSVMVSTTLSEKIRHLRASLEKGELKRSGLNEFLDDLDHGAHLIASGLHRSAELIHDFKQVAVDRASSQRRRFDLRHTVDEVLAVLRPRIKKTNYRIEVDIPDDIEMDSYPGPLGQVLTNLVQNALIHGFADRDTGTISIRTDRIDPDQIALSVADDGRGMAPDVLAKVFEPFFTTRLGQGGSGLGMNITYNLVTGVLGGRIALTSATDAGTTVRIELPLKPRTPEAATPPPQNKERS